MNTQASALSIEALSIQLKGGKHLLDNVSFSLQAGEVLAVIGPNGAGKTSLLKVLSGEPVSGQLTQEGEVAYADRLLKAWPQDHRAQQLAILPQLSLLNFPYTVEEVVQLGRTPHATGKQVDREIVTSVIQRLDLQALRSSLYTELSGGEKQRTQLARTLAQISFPEAAGDPAQRYLLLDEPTASLDLGHQQQLMQLIRDLAEQGVVVVMIVHDVNLAARYADKLLALQSGKVLAFGAASEVVTEAVMQVLYQVDVKVIQHPETGKPVVLGV